MPSIMGFVVAVPHANKERYIEHARAAAAVFKEYGATRIVEAWEDDVPDGELTSFPLAVKREPGEAIVFSWIEWPDRASGQEGMGKAMQDPRLSFENNPMPFDGRRMIFGSFDSVLDM